MGGRNGSGVEPSKFHKSATLNTEILHLFGKMIYIPGKPVVAGSKEDHGLKNYDIIAIITAHIEAIASCTPFRPEKVVAVQLYIVQFPLTIYVSAKMKFSMLYSSGKVYSFSDDLIVCYIGIVSPGFRLRQWWEELPENPNSQEPMTRQLLLYILV